VAGRADVDRHPVVGQGVGGGADLVPVVQPEGEVVEAAVGAGDQGDVVRGVGHLQPGGQLVAVVGQDLLGQPEPQDLAEEPGPLVDVLGGDEDVVEAGRGDPDQPQRPRRRVGPGKQVADLLHPVHQLAAVPGRGLEADGLAVPGGQLAPGVAGHPAAVLLDPVLEPLQVVGVLDLEAHVLQAVGGGIAQDHRVVLVLVPALEEHSLGVPARLQQPQHLGVVGGGQLQVGHPDLDMGQAQDPHVRCGPS
jgi:hypothetical protein